MVRLGLVVALIALCSATAHAIERARPMGLYPKGTGSPGGSLAYPTGNGGALAMVESRIDVTVRGPILETVVVQRFRNASANATEATYIFPLPADAAVSAMAIRVGGRTIRAAIEDREAAQQRYEAAVAAGVGAALLDQERPDVFTQAVSAIPPGGVVEVTLRYDAVARFEAGRWQLVVPMVVAPRHVPGTASGRATTGTGRAPDTDRAPDASRVTPAAAPGAGGSTVVTIHFVDEPAELDSPSHELTGRQPARLSDPRSDHDAIVRWRAPSAAAGWVERAGEGGFAAVVVEAPAAPPRTAPLRITLALDRAATTRGDGEVVERPLVRALLGALDRPDRVRLIAGEPGTWSAPGDVLAAIERRWSAPAAAFDLTRVLTAARPDGAPIVLISDGLIADDAAAVAAAKRLGVPVHVIGIGPAPARATLNQIAAITGGTVRYAVVGDDVPALARAVLADAGSPPAPLTINWGTLGASEVEPAALPRLGAGQAMLVVARIRRAQPANARTRGAVFAFEALAPARSVDGAVTAHGPLARRWARERLGELLAGPHDRRKVLDLALRYGLVSPYTSLVAVGTEIVVQGGVKHSVAVPVALPAGMQWQAVKQAMTIDAAGGVPATSQAPSEPRVPEAPAPMVRRPDVVRVPEAPRKDTSREDAEADDRAEGDVGDSVAQDVRKRAHRDDATPASKPAPARPPAPKATRPAEPAPRPTRAPVPGPTGTPAPRPTGTTAPTTPAPIAAAPAAPVAPPAAAPAPSTADAVLDDEELARIAAQQAGGEVITVTGSTIDSNRLNTTAPLTLDELSSLGEGEQLVVYGRPRRALRLTAALGGGLAFDHGTRGLATVTARIETTRRTALGGEAGLWLIDGRGAEARGLLTVGRGFGRWLELGLGAGVQFGNGTGVASALRLRIQTPVRWLGGYLRYDAAVLLTRPSVEAEHVVTLGLELSY